MTQTEVRLVFKAPPRLGFGLRDASSEPDQLVVKLDPSTGIRFELEARQAASREPRDRSISTWSSPTKAAKGRPPTRCSSHAAMVGQTVRFTRQDTVEEQWRIMQPLLDAPPPVHAYAPGSWGPEAASAFVAGHGALA